MIDNLYELNDVVNAVANRALDYVAGNSTSGQMYVSYDKFADLISEEDFLKYGEFIANELSAREEVLEAVNFENGELDINLGLAYCKAYQWCDGDENTFGCSFEEWLEKEPEPIYHPMSLSRFAELGAKAVGHIVYNDGQRMSNHFLGLTPNELLELQNKNPLISPTLEYIPGEDLLIGKWRVHIADTGEKYGTFNHLINNRKPVVEFFDMTHIDPKYCPNGQFTGGIYSVDTLLGKDGWSSKEFPQGLELMGDCPAWKVSAKEMKLIVSWLESFDSQRQNKVTLNQLIDAALQKKDAALNPDPDGRGPANPTR